MENLYIDESIVFENNRVKDFLDDFKNLARVYNSNALTLCVMLNDLKNIFIRNDSEQYLSCGPNLSIFRVKDVNNNSYNYYEFCEKVLSLEKSYVCKLNKVAIKFLNDDSGGAATLKGFTVSKLIELLPLSVEKVLELIDDGLLFPKMTFKQIRELVKSIKGKTSEDEESEEDIPLAFDPKQVYEFQYFDGLSKSQLVNIAMSYQNYIHKAKNG